MKLTNDAYNGLNKIAHKTKMDCWFYLTTDGADQDVVKDLETNITMSVDAALQDFVDGVTEPLDMYGLTSEEQKAVSALFAAVQKTDGGANDVYNTYDCRCGRGF